MTGNTEYKVELSLRAEADIEKAFDYILGDSPNNAVKWRHGLQKKLQILERMPESFGFAPENHDAKAEIRQLVYGQHRLRENAVGP